MKKLLMFLAISMLFLNNSKAQIASIDSFSMYRIEYDLSALNSDTLWVKKSDLNSIGDTMWYRAAGTSWLFVQNGDVKPIRLFAVGKISSGTFNSNAPAINNSPGRSLNSNFTISSDKYAIVTYWISLSTTSSLLGSSSAIIYLEYSINSGSTWLSAISAGNSNSITLTLGLQLVNIQTSPVSGVIPINALVRIRTAVTGTATITYLGGQEATF